MPCATFFPISTLFFQSIQCDFCVNFGHFSSSDPANGIGSDTDICAVLLQQNVVNFYGLAFISGRYFVYFGAHSRPSLQWLMETAFEVGTVKFFKCKP